MNRYVTALLLFLIFLTIYYCGSFDRIPFADCTGFVLTVEQGDYITTATATSHFLYINTAILFKDIFSLSGIEANRALVIISAALSVVVVYFSIFTLNANKFTSFVAAVIFDFSFSFWRNAEIIEVYTFNCLWIALFIFCMIKSFYSENTFYIVLCGLFFGVSMWVHIQNVLMIPGFLTFIYYMRFQKKQAITSLVLFAFIFSALFILNYSQGLPLNSPYSSDQGEWLADSFKKNSIQYITDFIKSIFYLVYNFTFFIFFGIVGIFTLYKENRKMFFVFLVCSFFVYGFSTFYAVSDNYVFFLPFNIIFAIAIGYGFTYRENLFKKTSFTCAFIPVFYILSFCIVGKTAKGKAFDDFKSYKGGIAYYLLPWMNNNKGIIEFVIDKKTAPEPIHWMKASVDEYVKLMKSKGFTESEIKKF
ncbi:Protein of unknown function [Chryseobacterium piscicola]|uniref:DUF2723 domain-containing protein n=1 Tax=Chryseobacterium piscicola TaxID=551459 RepID=A0A1N7NA73_9FLAO|nr:DUF2723 domain-containing protein [Chryseobacterium piscicola]PQA92244.1 hypothetical protein B0A70_11530 [Chryseobacterium piscicola]SIS95222.1 Protein of unknown function [Chryseobacterium piscicola]